MALRPLRPPMAGYGPRLAVAPTSFNAVVDAIPLSSSSFCFLPPSSSSSRLTSGPGRVQFGDAFAPAGSSRSPARAQPAAMGSFSPAVAAPTQTRPAGQVNSPYARTRGAPPPASLAATSQIHVVSRPARPCVGFCCFPATSLLVCSVGLSLSLSSFPTASCCPFLPPPPQPVEAASMRRKPKAPAAAKATSSGDDGDDMFAELASTRTASAPDAGSVEGSTAQPSEDPFDAQGGQVVPALAEDTSQVGRVPRGGPVLIPFPPGGANSTRLACPAAPRGRGRVRRRRSG